MSVSDVLASSDSVDIAAWEDSPETWLESYGTASKIAALKIASYLNEPICKVREYFYRLYTLDKTCSTATQKAVQIALLTLGMAVCALLAPFTAPTAAGLRGIVASLESKPYIYLERSRMGKALPLDRRITLVSHNQCYVPAGYSITDGQVTPPSDRERMDANLRKMKELDPDILCLYEVADIYDAEYLSSNLPEYPFIIPVAGIRAAGPSSMMYIASKYEIVKSSIEFVPFEKGTELSGRAQFSEKGFLSFDIRSRGERGSFATVISTHLQHSEIPACPEDHERISRFAQMRKIAKQIQRKVDLGRPVIFTGDLNQPEEELRAFFARHQIQWLKRDPRVEGRPTWDGDKWCAELMGKRPSCPQVLDYTFVAGKASAISTRIIKGGYSGLEFRREATSDHELLFSTITLE